MSASQSTPEIVVVPPSSPRVLSPFVAWLQREIMEHTADIAIARRMQGERDGESQRQGADLEAWAVRNLGTRRRQLEDALIDGTN